MVTAVAQPRPAGPVDGKPRRAFVLEPDRRYRVSAAEQHGEVTYLFALPGARPRVGTPRYLDVCVRRLQELAYDPHEDYIVVSGAMPAVSVLLVGLMARYGAVKMLVYDEASAGYIPQHIRR